MRTITLGIFFLNSKSDHQHQLCVVSCLTLGLFPRNDVTHLYEAISSVLHHSFENVLESARTSIATERICVDCELRR